MWYFVINIVKCFDIRMNVNMWVARYLQIVYIRSSIFDIISLSSFDRSAIYHDSMELIVTHLTGAAYSLFILPSTRYRPCPLPLHPSVILKVKRL